MLIVTFNNFLPTRLFSTTCLLIFAKLSLLHGYLALHVYLEHKSRRRHKVKPFVTTIVICIGILRGNLPIKNKNKPPRLSTDPRYLSKSSTLDPYNFYKSELFNIFSTLFFLKWVCSTKFD